MATPIKIPISQPDLSGNEESYVVEAIRSTWISSSGKFLDRFESEFATACDAKSALAVCNGTVALHLAMLGLNVRAGDEVLVPALTYVATANAVRYVGAEPVFVDVDPDTWCMDPTEIEKAITPRTRGIIPVHLYGNPAEMDEISQIAAIHGLWVVEDAAEAHFATYKSRPVGGLGSIGTFSFYGNKILSSGEGGAVVVNDMALALRLKALRGQGMDPRRRYYHPITGYNFRLTNVAAAILCAQMERAQSMLDARRSVCDRYRERLDVTGQIGFQEVNSWCVASPWMMCVLLPRTDSSTSIASKLAEIEIETRPLFVPLHRLPPFREMSEKRGEAMPVSDDLSKHGLCLPTYVGLTVDQIDLICDTILGAL